MIFPKRISVKLGLLTQTVAQNCPPKPDKSEHEARFFPSGEVKRLAGIHIDFRRTFAFQ